MRSGLSVGNLPRRTKSQLIDEISDLRRQLAVLKSEPGGSAALESEDESRYRSIYESSTVGICTTDADGRLVHTNPAY